MDNQACERDSQTSIATDVLSESAVSKPEDSVQPTYIYGWLCYQGKKVQRFNKPVWFLVSLCLLAICQGLVVTGVANTNLTSIEKQFGYTSFQVGLFGTSYDVAYGICSIFVGYIGHVHKPRFLGWGAILMAVGCATLTLPRFIFGPYQAGNIRDVDICRPNDTSYQPDCGQSSEWYYMFLFLSGNVLMGIGATPLYILGPAHIDEISYRGQSNFFLGISYACSAIGPAIGFIIGKPILNTWVDITQPKDSNLKPTDRNWVGAWWIGYLIGAGILLLPVLPLLGFPRRFPNTADVIKSKRQCEDNVSENEKLKHDFKSAWPALKGLLTNRTFMLLCFASSAESLITGGVTTFLPKFIETHFHVTSSDSALYTGCIVIPGAVGGIFLGGYVSKRFKWNCSTTLKAVSILAFVAELFTLVIFIGCDGRSVVGSDVPYYNSSAIDLNGACRGSCNCSVRFYKPICTEADRLTYFSPCHAGCQEHTIIGTNYFNCSCFPPGITKAVEGRCKPPCVLFPVFAVALFLLIFFTFFSNVPFIDASFRVVPEGQGSFAMGFQQVLNRFLGLIPAPTLFGTMIDRSCQLWNVDECTGGKLSCLEYDNDKFRLYVFILCVSGKFLSSSLAFIAYRLYTPPASKGVTQVEPCDMASRVDDVVMEAFPPAMKNSKVYPAEETAAANLNPCFSME